MRYDMLLYAVDDRVATITLNRPERLNAFNLQLMDELPRAIAQADSDPGVRVIIVSGAGGKAFSSGYDMKETTAAPITTLPQMRARMQKDIQFTYSVWDCSKPVIALIDGFCLAGALEFAMCCDMRYCSDSSTFAALEARFSTGISTMIMPWLLGQRARALIYSGDTIDASEAYRLGLVDKIFTKASLHEEVHKIASRMSRVSLECLQADKRALNQTFEIMGLRQAIEYGAEACTLMNFSGSEEKAKFMSIRKEQGLGPALKWRAAQFAPYE